MSHGSTSCFFAGGLRVAGVLDVDAAARVLGLCSAARRSVGGDEVGLRRAAKILVERAGMSRSVWDVAR